MNIEALLPCYVEAQKPTRSVLIAIRGSWPKFVRFCRVQGLARVDEITQKMVEDFHKSLLWEPNEKGQWYKGNSVDQFVMRARQVLRWAFQEGLLERDPTVGLLLPRQLVAVHDLLTSKQLQTLMKAPDKDTPLGLRDALMLALLTQSSLGLQVVTLSLDSVRQLELEAASWTLLAEYLERGRPALARSTEEKALFLGKFGEPLGGQAVALRLNEMAKQAGLGKRLPSRVLRQSYLAALQPLRDRHSFP